MKIKTLLINTVHCVVCWLMLGSSAFADIMQTTQPWDKLLKKNSLNGQINYESIKLDDDLLKASVKGIEMVSQEEFDSLSKNELMSFWINAYNIGVVKTIVEHYPIKKGFGLNAVRYPANSIQQIDQVWDRPVLTILGKNLSLNDIENKILRPQFNDPRIHFAIVCASIGCPSIRSEAFTAENLDKQLLEQIQLFLSDPNKVRYDTQKNILFLSPIFKWFMEDFDQSGGVIAFVMKYKINGLFDVMTEKTKIQWLGYDWSLNDSHE